MYRTTSCCCLLVIALFAHSALGQMCLLADSSDSTVPSKNIPAELYRGQQAFTIGMLSAIQKATPNENIFFSPYSTYHALLLTYFGARGATEKELVQGLRLEWAKDKNQVHSAYRLEKRNRFTRSKKMPLEFASADRVYVDKSIELTTCIQDSLFDEIASVDFSNKSEQIRVEINDWIAQLTRNEIRDMLSVGDVTPLTQLVLANAAYFKGKWANQFDPKETQKEVFYTSPNQTSFVQMMHKRGTFNLAVDETLGTYILQMPYLTSNNEDDPPEMSMLIFLPPWKERSLEMLLSKLTPDTLENALSSSMAREIDVSLPKFDFEQRVELVPILANMGIGSIFEPTADFTDFSAKNKINFGDAKHVAKIKVDEEGSTAAAATVLFSFRSARPLEPTVFKCDHPFLFMIYDHKTRAVLFTGIYRDPKTQQ